MADTNCQNYVIGGSVFGEGAFVLPKHFIRPAFLSLALLIASCGGNSKLELGWPDSNVILISIDTLRADHLGCYGYALPTSPNIDALAKSGVLFSTTIAQAPSTTPSHASIFTSRLPMHHGAKRSTNQPISPAVPTMAEILKNSGYRTVSFNGGGQVAAEFGFDRGFDVYESVDARQPFNEKIHSALQWMSAHPDEKFFMFLHTYDTHAPYTPDPERLALFDAGYTGSLPSDISFTELRRINNGELEVSEQDMQHIAHAYDGEIHAVDAAIGNLVKYLKDVGTYNDTIMIFTSDHGEELGEHGQVGRHTYSLYDEVLRVPFIVKLPGNHLASTQVDDQVRSIDLLPTLLDLIDLDAPKGLAGISLVPHMQQRGVAPNFAISQQDTENPMPPTMIRTDSRKLIIRPAILDDENRFSQWFGERADFPYQSRQLMLSIASASELGSVEIFFNNKRGPVVEIGPDRRNIPLVVSNFPSESNRARAGSRKARTAANGFNEVTVSVRSRTPCVEVADSHPDSGGRCLSFRLFNPYDYYLIDTDPTEQENVYEEPTYALEIEHLRSELFDILIQGLRGTDGEPGAILDSKMIEQLKSLGYIQ